MFEQMVLRAQFIDRAGRVVYMASPLKTSVDEEGTQRGEEGAPAFMIRLALKPGEDSHDVEWLTDPNQPQLAPDEKPEGFVPGEVTDENGVEGGGTG